jgi:uncharacterized protein (TIGR03083 family)
MDPHDAIADRLGAWALDGVDERGEAAAVEEHLRTCAACASEARRLRAAAGWLGVQDVIPAPAGLREKVLAEATRRRPPTLLRTLTQAYAAQVELLDEVLGTVAPDAWQYPDPRHGDVRGLLAHLAGNDAMLAADLGGKVVTPADGDVRMVWRLQAELLLSRLATVEAAPSGAAADPATEPGAAPVPAGVRTLDRPVRLAARRGTPVRPLRDALVQRAFETWTHRDDLAAVVGRPQEAPLPAEVRRIVDLSVRVLPGALRTAGLVRPEGGVRLVLEGPGEGEWFVPLGHPGPVSRVDATVRADAVAYTRLVAGRRAVASLGAAVTGSTPVAAQFLEVASTLGCD